MSQQESFSTEVAIVYRKIDGKIARVSTIPPHLTGIITEKDMDKLFPGVDMSDFNIVIIKGRQYLEIDRFRVQTDVDGKFVDIVEKIDVLSHFNEEVQINPELLDRDADIVISVLAVIDDPNRLRKYKELEQEGQNRSEVINFFLERGIK